MCAVVHSHAQSFEDLLLSNEFFMTFATADFDLIIFASK